MLGPAGVGVPIGKQLGPPVIRGLGTKLVEGPTALDPQREVVQARPSALVGARDIGRLLQNDVRTTGVMPGHTGAPSWLNSYRP